MSSRTAVYLIDDDRALREAACALLQSFGFNAHAYPTTGAFLREGATHGDGCLVADADGPDFADRDLLACFREHGISLPTILTSHRPADQRLRYWPQGGATWLDKPFSPEDLLDRIGKVVGGRLI